ncbi:MAG: hypothetical protein PHE21_03015, partial [Candidatus Dojkabacteria bacterium]|nr:hypothetical protein [Candidatus Dojkabacteria bacterium]
EGTKEQTYYEESCDFTCDTYHFDWREYEDCPDGYKVDKEDESMCIKKDNPDIERKYTDYSYDIPYIKSEDKNKCHRPSDSQLEDDYGMTSDAVKALKKEYKEWYDGTPVCEFLPTSETRTVDCKDAELIPCYEICSETTTSYGDWSNWDVDNENESLLVRTRLITYYDSVETEYVCDTKTEEETDDRPLCQYPTATYADDPLCLPEEEDDDGDVLGDDDEVKDTGVVLGATGPGDNLDIYLVELLLVAISIVSSVFLSKKYLKNSR